MKSDKIIHITRYKESFIQDIGVVYDPVLDENDRLYDDGMCYGSDVVDLELKLHNAYNKLEALETDKG